jgi:hypothetical protein
LKLKVSEIQILGKIGDFRIKAENIQDEPGEHLTAKKSLYTKINK